MKILLIGCGKMGSAMMDGWLQSGIKASAITIVDPFYKGRAAAYKSTDELPKKYAPDVVILAIKPQSLDEALLDLARFKNALFISIVAGKTIASIQKHLGNVKVVRTMPNLPAVIGQGVIAAVSAKRLSADDKEAVGDILEPCGKLLWFKDEKLIDSVTAISGSGPAYVFLFAQSLVEAGIELGLDDVTAKILALETIKGSAMLAESSEYSLDGLKVNVTSKGGTTEAALKVLEKGNVLKKLIKDAAKQAKKRAGELSA